MNVDVAAKIDYLGTELHNVLMSDGRRHFGCDLCLTDFKRKF